MPRLRLHQSRKLEAASDYNISEPRNREGLYLSDNQEVGYPEKLPCVPVVPIGRVPLGASQPELSILIEILALICPEVPPAQIKR